VQASRRRVDFSFAVFFTSDFNGARLDGGRVENPSSAGFIDHGAHAGLRLSRRRGPGARRSRDIVVIIVVVVRRGRAADD